MDTCAWCGKPYRRSSISRWPHCSSKCLAEDDADWNERRDRRRERRAAESSQYDEWTSAAERVASEPSVFGKVVEVALVAARPLGVVLLLAAIADCLGC